MILQGDSEGEKKKKKDDWPSQYDLLKTDPFLSITCYHILLYLSIIIIQKLPVTAGGDPPSLIRREGPVSQTDNNLIEMKQSDAHKNANAQMLLVPADRHLSAAVQSGCL